MNCLTLELSLRLCHYKNMSSIENKFSSEGFVVLKDFLSPLEVSELLENVDRFIAEVVPSLHGDQVFYEEKEKPETLKQIQFMFKHDSYFHLNVCIQLYPGKVCQQNFLAEMI